MIKAVLQAISIYTMCVFFLLEQLIHGMMASICNFQWGAYNQCAMAWKDLQHICMPKSQNGMGFQDLHAFEFGLVD